MHQTYEIKKIKLTTYLVIHHIFQLLSLSKNKENYLSFFSFQNCKKNLLLIHFSFLKLTPKQKSLLCLRMAIYFKSSITMKTGFCSPKWILKLLKINKYYAYCITLLFHEAVQIIYYISLSVRFFTKVYSFFTNFKLE